MSFGESALLDERVRSADVRVEQATEVAVLHSPRSTNSSPSTPTLGTRLYRNLAQMLAARLQGRTASPRSTGR